MLRRSLLVSAVLLASSFGFAGSAKAAPSEVDVPFTGTVAGNCSFGTIAQGTLGLNTAGNALDSKAVVTGGASGSVPLSCTGAATVSVQIPADAPVLPLTTNPTTTTNLGMIAVAGKTTDSAGTPISLTATEATSATIAVDMTASIASGSFAPGNYGYTVKVVATPGI
jgi:hypothetical protein